MVGTDLRAKLDKPKATRAELLEEAIMLADKDHPINPNILGVNAAFSYLGVQNTELNELFDTYSKEIARSVARIGFECYSLRGKVPHIVELARVVYHFGEPRARVLVVNQALDPRTIETPVQPKYQN